MGACPWRPRWRPNPALRQQALRPVARDWLQVTVTDSGIGIHPEDKERIFVEFEQVDSSYGRQQQGTGLGLTLTRRLIEMHGGRIWVDSEGVEGKGSRFTFLLPLPTAEHKTGLPLGETGLDDKILRPLVLVLTRIASQSASLGDYLTDAGYGVAMVSDTEGMAAALKSKRPYAVAIDDEVAQNFDAQALRDLRSRIPAKVPAVFFSLDGEERPGFSLFPGEWVPRTPVRSRLMDAIRQASGMGGTSGKEVKTVLIIDDEPALLELLTKTLLQKGFQVIQASEGRRGFEFATACRPDVIVLDRSMPEYDGIQVVEELRARVETRNIPVLIHTGTVLKEEDRQLLAGHVYSITSKTDTQSLLADLDRLEGAPAEKIET